MSTKVHARIKKTTDFETHLRTVKENGVEVIELRDYVPSEKWYGRGVQFEKHQIPQVLESLQSLANYLGGDAAPGSRTEAQRAADSDPNQGKLF